MMDLNQTKKSRPRVDADDAEICYRMECGWCGKDFVVASEDSKGMEEEQIEEAFREVGLALAQDDDTYGVACKSCQHYHNLEVCYEDYTDEGD